MKDEFSQKIETIIEGIDIFKDELEGYSFADPDNKHRALQEVESAVVSFDEVEDILHKDLETPKTTTPSWIEKQARAY